MKRADAIVLAGLLALPVPALADAIGASATGAAAATVVSPVAVRQIADLDFGVITANVASTGAVELAPGAGHAVYSGSARRGCAEGTDCPAPHAAQFEVSGEAGRSYAITAPESVAVPGEVTAPVTGSEDRTSPPALWIEALRFRSASRPEAGPAGRLDAQGQDHFELGGTLRVPAALPPARYRASVPVVITYS